MRYHMREQITKSRLTDTRLIGAVLIVIGSVWGSLQPLAPELAGAIANPLSSIVFGSAGIGAVHIVFGIYVSGTEQLGRSVSFVESVLVGVGAFIIGSGVLYYWEFLQSGSVLIDLAVSFPFFVCYVAMLAFPLGVARTRRQRLATIGTLCAIPAVLLASIPFLILLD